MKRAILLTLAAGVATLPALWGVTGNTTFGQSVPAAVPSGASVAPSVDDRTAPSGPTASATADDRRGRGSDDATTISPTRATTVTTTSGSRSASAKATSSATVDDKGRRTQGVDDSGGHGGKSGSGKG